MGYIHVNSPYDNNPVKVLEKDIGKAVKDGEGRMFYVLPRSDGSGYFGAISRKDAGKEEQEAAHRDAKQSRADAASRRIEPAAGGTSRTGSVRMILGLVILAAIAAGGYLWWSGIFSA